MSSLAWILLGGFLMSAVALVGASDLIPEIKAHHSLPRAVLHFGCFVAGLLMMLLFAIVFPNGA